MTAILVGDMRHNHNKKLAALLTNAGLHGGVVSTRVLHEHHCHVFTRRVAVARGAAFCNCDPDIEVVRDDSNADSVTEMKHLRKPQGA